MKPISTQQILITGGAGFVGSHLADGLLREGHRVRVLDNLTPQVHGGLLPEYLSQDVELLRGDICDEGLLRRALSGVDAVFHFAAAVGVGQSMYEISRYMMTNTLGTASLLQAMLDNKANVSKLVVASSMSVYGEGEYSCAGCGITVAPPVRRIDQLRAGTWDVKCPTCGGDLVPQPTREEKPSELTSVYALSKRDQEELCMIYGRTYGLPVVALRFFNIYGTRQALSNRYTGVAAIFASRLLNQQPPLIFEDGQQQRDFVSIHDIVQANLLALAYQGKEPLVCNIGSGQPITISQVAQFLGGALGTSIQPSVTRKFRAGDIRHCYADISRARSILGYEPKVSHLDGFAELAQWLSGQQAEDKAEASQLELTRYGLSA